MGFLRRDFLKLGLTQAFVSAVGFPAFAATEQDDRGVDGLPFQTAQRLTPSILQGATDATRTQFSILHLGEQKFNVVVRNSSARVWQPEKLEILQQPFSQFQITKVYFSGLNLGETFYLDLLGSQDEVIERREFGMLDLSKSTLRYALCSCMDESRHEPRIWQNLVGQKPDMIFFIGDSTYCDKGESQFPDGDPRRLWDRYVQARRTLEIYYSQRLIPIVATWDDHDFGSDDVNTTNWNHVPESQVNFRAFFAQADGYTEGYYHGPGVSSALRAGQHQFLLMDDRSWRLEKNSLARYAHWGQEQEEWALQMIAGFEGTTWIMNGSQIFPEMIYKESMSKHKGQFNGFMGALKRIPRKVIFASGDVHFSEISKIESAMLGYQTYEITSSAVHSKCFPGLDKISKHPRRMMCTTMPNYILVDSIHQAGTFAANVYSCSARSVVNFSCQLTV